MKKRTATNEGPRREVVETHELRKTFFIKFNNLVEKFLNRSRYLKQEEEVGKMSLEIKQAYINSRSKEYINPLSSKRQKQTMDDFFSEIDKITSKTLNENEKKDFLDLLRQVQANTLFDKQDWERVTKLTQRVYDALIAAGYNHLDLWT